MGKRADYRPHVRAACRGEGCGYVAFGAGVAWDDLRAEVRTARGEVLPCQLFCVEMPGERALVAPGDACAWIVVFPLLERSCIVSLWAGEERLAQHVFSRVRSKLESRLLTWRNPRLAAFLRGFEQRRGAGRPQLRVREVWPADDGLVAWRLQAESPTADGATSPSLKVCDAWGDEVQTRVVVMEDHVVPSWRDKALLVRLVTFSALLPEGLGDVFAVARPGGDAGMDAGMAQEAFACMNAPRAHGMLADVRRLSAGAAANGDYEGWFADMRATQAELARQRAAASELPEEARPLVSIVMSAHRGPSGFLREAIGSVCAQSYDRWELIVANAGGSDFTGVNSVPGEFGDARVRELVLESRSVSDSTNAALELAQGDYIAFLDPDDLLEPDALWRFVEELLVHPEADLLYCDEDCLGDGHLFGPTFKIFPNYGRLYTHNCVSRFLMVSRRALELTERSGEDVAGAQDFDLTLKTFEVAREVVHVPRVLYHRREHEGPAVGGGDQTPYAHEAGRRALEAHLARRSIAARVDDGPLPCTYRVRYTLPDPLPPVSIVIPTRDQANLLSTCVSSILERSTYGNYEVVLVENNSRDQRTFELYDELRARDGRVRVVVWEPPEPGAFNYSAVVNRGVRAAKGSYVVLLNNDTEVIEHAWLEEMLGCLMRPEVGVVGAKLLFYDGLIQHVGMVANPNGDNCHVYQNLTRDALGAGGQAAMPGDYAMVTGACQMVRRELWDELGGYDEHLAVGFNDTDFCLRAGEAGYAVTMAAHALLYHREFSTRGREVTDGRLRARQLAERSYTMGRHADFYAQGDPVLNPNLNPFGAYGEL